MTRERIGAWTGSVAALLLIGCGGGNAPATPPPPEVSVVTVEPATLPETFEFPGQVQPYRRVEVRARVEGIVVARPFTEGSDVRAGQLLYQLDTVRLAAAYRSAQAQLQNAESTYERLKPLLTQHAVAQQTVDDARARYLSALSALDQANKDLEDTRVRAEMAGRVGRTRIDVGGRVTGPADLLTMIDRLDPIYITFQPSSEQLLAWQANPSFRALIQPGSDLVVRAVLPDSTVLARIGRLDFVAPALDSASGTLEFRAAFPNPDRLLVPGEFLRVRLSGFEREAALAVPQKAVQTGLGRQFVYVVGPGDTAVVRDVRTGPWSDGLWIIESGLEAGDRVVVDGVQKVRPGQPVRPAPLATDTAAPADSRTRAAAPADAQTDATVPADTAGQGER